MQNSSPIPFDRAPLAEWLAEVYGDGNETQLARYCAALDRFADLAGPGPAEFFRAPGRVNLIGEHTDYNQGYVMPLALDRDTLMVVRPRSDRFVRLWNLEAERFPPRTFELKNNIDSGPVGDWGNYARGVGQELFRCYGGRLTGMDALVVGAAPYGVPIAAGLSSSSALVVVTASALAALAGIEINRPELAQLCSEAEWYVGTRGGIMDQFIALLAQRGHAMLLDCRPKPHGDNGVPEYAIRHVPLPAGYRFMILNSMVERQKTRSQYNARVAECRIGVKLLRAGHPGLQSLRDVESWELHGDELGEVLDRLPERIDRRGLQIAGLLDDSMAAMLTDFRLPEEQEFRVRARCRHVITENERVLESVPALQAGDAVRLGQLLDEAHRSMSVDYEASCEEVDALAAIARQAPGVAGARVTGAGWGGCVIALVEDGQQDAAAEAIQHGYAAAAGVQPDIFVCHSAPGAGQVGQAVSCG